MVVFLKIICAVLLSYSLIDVVREYFKNRRIYLDHGGPILTIKMKSILNIFLLRTKKFIVRMFINSSDCQQFIRTKEEKKMIQKQKKQEKQNKNRKVKI